MLKKLKKYKPERLKKGQRFQECDKRFIRVVEIVGFSRGRVKIETVLNIGNVQYESLTAEIEIRRTTTARRDRFHRRSHGYRRLYGHCHICQLDRGAKVPTHGHMGITMTIGVCCACLKPGSALVPSSDYDWPKEGKLAIWD